LNGWVLGFTLVCLTAGLACGFFPAVECCEQSGWGFEKKQRASASVITDSTAVISESRWRSYSHRGWMLLRSFQHLLEVDPGFRQTTCWRWNPTARDFVCAVQQLSPERRKPMGEAGSSIRRNRAEIRTLPGVRDVGESMICRWGRNCQARFISKAADTSQRSSTDREFAREPGIFSSWIPLRAGAFSLRMISSCRNTSSMKPWLGVLAQGTRSGKASICFTGSQACWTTIIGITGMFTSMDSTTRPHTTFILREDGRRIPRTHGSEPLSIAERSRGRASL